MATQLIIQLAREPQQNIRWVRIESGTGATPVASGSLSDLASQASGAQIVVMVPGTDVTMTQVNVPTTNKQRMLKAIPFAVEDQIAEAVEDVHFAVGSRNEDGTIPTVAVAREKMDQWMAELSNANVHPHALIADISSIPVEEDSWTLLADGDLLYVIRPQLQGMTIDLENAPFLLELLLEEAEEERPARLVFYGEDSQGDALNPNLEEVGFEIRPLDGGLLEFLAGIHQGVLLEKSINLLQGDYSRREQIGKLLRPWRFAASLAGVWFVLQLGMSIYDVSALESEKEHLDAEIEKVYRSAFPQAKKVVNPRVQMQRQLDTLKGGGSSNEAGFLSLLGDSGAAFRQTGGLVLHSVRYKNDTLDVELEVNNLQVLDQLKQKLSTEAKLKVEIQSAAARDNKVQGRLNIKKS